jgi:serine protease Do
LKVPPPHWVIPADLGIKAATLTDKVRVEEDMPASLKGALVVDVSHGTDAARRGLVPGDVIMQVGDVAVDSDTTLFQQVEAARKSGNDLAMFLVFPKNKGKTGFPSPKWIPMRVNAS